MDLTGRVLLVTGASRGIGRAVAVRAARDGARVVLVARDGDALEALAGECGEAAVAHAADVRSEAEVARLLEEVAERFGGLDVLVNNAGVMVPGPIASFGTDDFRHVFDTNVLGPFLLMRGALPLLAGRDGATIVNVASLAPTVAQPGLGVYAASKAALLALTDALREEAREGGIRVASILPGSTRTSLFEPDGDGSWMLDPDDVADAILRVATAPPRALQSRVEVRPVRRRRREHPPRR
ncbi:MAG: SDR family oxidoreductase [Planctomycetota bacterium JB042]